MNNIKMVDICTVLNKLYPTAKYTIGSGYKSLDWQDEEIPKPTKAELKAKVKELTKEYEYGEALKMINDTFEAELQAITQKYPNSEKATWELQKTQANEFIQNKDKSKAPLIVALAKAKDIDTLEFAKLVLSKVESYENQVTKALVKKQKAINELKTSK